MSDQVETAPADHPNLPAKRKRPGMPREGEKPVKVSPNEETFLNAFLDTGKRAVAYRMAYKVKAESDGEWVYVQAWKVMQRPKVRLRLEQLKAIRAAAMIVNADTLVRELDQARDLALEAGDLGVAVSATREKARITGHIAAPAGRIGVNAAVNTTSGVNGGVNSGIAVNITFSQADENAL
jgi:hypothetical protein